MVLHFSMFSHIGHSVNQFHSRRWCNGPFLLLSYHKWFLIYFEHVVFDEILILFPCLRRCSLHIALGSASKILVKCRLLPIIVRAPWSLGAHIRYRIFFSSLDFVPCPGWKLRFLLALIQIYVQVVQVVVCILDRQIRIQSQEILFYFVLESFLIRLGWALIQIDDLVQQVVHLCHGLWLL